jgi:hypothetical protein
MYELQLTFIAPFLQHPLDVVHFICNHSGRHNLRKSIYYLFIYLFINQYRRRSMPWRA